MNKYYIYKNRYVQNNLESINLFYDFFLNGVKIKFYFLRRVLFFILKQVIIFLYKINAFDLFFKSIKLKESYLICIKSKGKWANQIKLYKEKNRYIIIKEFKNKYYLEKEKKFYLKYLNKSKIIIPKMTFFKKSIKMDFIPHKTLQRSITDGYLNKKEILNLVLFLKKELHKMYSVNKKTKKYLVHGDLTPLNIIYDRGNHKIYLIDFTDSFVYNINYDLYLLYNSIFNFYDINPKNEKIRRELKISNQELKRLKKIKNKKYIKKNIIFH